MDQYSLCNGMVGLFREERHDFLNHLQIVLGYLQINKEESAIAYIKQVHQEMQEISALTRLENPFLVVALLLATQKSKHFDIKLSFHMEQSLTSLQEYQESVINKLMIIMDQILEFLDLNSTGYERQVEIAFQENDHHIIWVITCSPDVSLESVAWEWQNQREQAWLSGNSCQVEKSEHETRLTVYIAKNN
ncbi:Spo0B domain-containing protein [Dehalobacterium formicoaceticum]|uniref:Spo0B domain-containing protein n=1 Tax=Dehalobacterium formicoaceticum TaxID=51515 RepID=A0ABT1Y5M6_9FIRM|nr:Spo0B domain-containing protein [Dehalobacterium formicoaceticum]MCR6544991.1 Spo0B domain-containing protein [Dehalobacterium formicoaceticum]